MRATPRAGWRQTAIEFAELGRQLMSEGDPDDVLTALPILALQRLPAADSVSITTYREDGYHSDAATDARAIEADQLQYELNEGPCLDAANHGNAHRPGDLNRDPRWPAFGPRVVQDCGFVSMLSIRLVLDEHRSSLNCYSEMPDAFDDHDLDIGLLLATHAGLALTAGRYRHLSERRDRALHDSRTVGIATGLLMAHHKLSREHAFDLLRVAGQRLDRRVIDLATDIAQTGTLPT